MKNVLFICVHNSARSQMAAALLNRACPEEFHAESAGLEPGTLNPIVVESLQEIGIDISKIEPRAVFDVFKSRAKIFTYVVTVCSEADGEGCQSSRGRRRVCTGRLTTLPSLPAITRNGSAAPVKSARKSRPG